MVILLADINTEINEIAKGTPGAVGADLANIINEAALRAVKQGRNSVLQEDLRDAVEVIIAGKEKKDRILSEKEKNKPVSQLKREEDVQFQRAAEIVKQEMK